MEVINNNYNLSTYIISIMTYIISIISCNAFIAFSALNSICKLCIALGINPVR